MLHDNQEPYHGNFEIITSTITVSQIPTTIITTMLFQKILLTLLTLTLATASPVFRKISPRQIKLIEQLDDTIKSIDVRAADPIWCKIGPPTKPTFPRHA